MAVAFDAVGPSSAGTSSLASTTLSWTHTNVGSNVAVIVGVACGAHVSDASETLSVTCGGAAMTSLGIRHANDQSFGFVQLFGKNGVGSGAQSIVVTESGGNTPTSLVGGSVSYTGVGSFSAAQTNIGASVQTISVAFTGSTSGNMVTGCLAIGTGTGLNISAGTSRWKNAADGTSGVGNAGMADIAGGGTVTLSLNQTGASDIAAGVAVELQAGTFSAGTTQINPVTVQVSRTWQRRWNHFVRPNIPPSRQQVAVNVPAAVVSARAPAVGAPYIAGMAGTGTGKYFVDQSGLPRFMLLEQCWGLPWNAGKYNSGDWQADYTLYFSNRSAQGHTAWFGTAWGTVAVDPSANNFGQTWDNIYPLNINGTPGGISTGSETITLNNSFWTRIDAFFATAKKYGISCFLNLGMSYDFKDANQIWTNATSTQMQAFGSALAARYPQSSYPHVFWFFGDDAPTTGAGGSDSLTGSTLTGLTSGGDARNMTSYEQDTETNSHIRFDTGAVYISGGFGVTNANFNWVYTYVPNYLAIEKSYTETGTTAIPVVWGDGPYYGDSAATTDAMIRRFTWWALASGARGLNNTSGPSGTGAVAHWLTGGEAGVTSDPNGSWITNDALPVITYFTSLTDWWKLVPDTGNVFITAGRGTKASSTAPGSTSPNYGASDTYVAGSITPAGSLAVIYCATAMSITINQSKMAGTYTAFWVDPATGAATPTTTGSTYSSSGLGNNSQGGPDWALVLVGVPTFAGVAAASVVAPPPVAAVTVTAGVATVSAAAPAGQAAAGGSPPAAAVSAVALAPVTASTATAGAAVVSVVAPAASDAATVTAGVAVVSAGAPQPVAAVVVFAGVAVVNALAPQPVVNTSGNTNAPAGVAVVSVIAPAATAAEGALSGAAPVQAVAPAPSVAETVTAGAAVVQAIAPAPQAAAAATPVAAAVSAVARAPLPVVTVTAGVAVVNALAPQPVVNTSGNTNAPAGVAAVTVTAIHPTAAAAVTVPVPAAAAKVGPPGTQTGPITISAGGTYSGLNVYSADSTVAAISITTASPVTINGATIYHAGVGINAHAGTQLTVTNSTFTALPPTTVNPEQQGINAGDPPASFVVEHNRFYYGHGISVVGASGGSVTTSPYSVSYNDFIDCGKLSHPGTFQGAIHNNQMAIPDGQIIWNRVTSHYGSSWNEDVISLSNSSGGTSGHPVTVAHCLVNGDYPTAPSTGFGTFTGACFNLHDITATPGHVHASYLYAVNFANTGIAVPTAAPDITIDSCAVVTDGVADDGSTTVSSGFGAGMDLTNHYAGANPLAVVTNSRAANRRWNGSSFQATLAFEWANQGAQDGGGNTTITADQATELAMVAEFEASVLTAGVTIGPAAGASTAAVAVLPPAGIALARGLNVPPVFTLGTLTATDAAAGVLTASDIRTGGPT